MNRRGIPADFGEHALEPSRDLQLRYHIAAETVRRWRRAIGVTVPCGAPMGNRNSIGNASRRKATHGIDGPEAVKACLSCTAPRCSGSCWRVR